MLIVGTMNNMMGGINNQTTSSVVLPPISKVTYHAAINGYAMEPVDLSGLLQMETAGQFTDDSLVWKEWNSAIGKVKNGL